jgi:nucleoid-associated protein YgaU
MNLTTPFLEGKMKFSNKLLLLLMIGALSLALALPAVAQEQKMSMDEYQAALNEARQRETTAKAEIAKLDEEIARLRSEMASTEQQTTATWDEIYSMLGTDRAGVEAYRTQMRSLESDIDGLMALSDDELYKRRTELDQLQARIDEMKKSNISKLTEMQDWIAALEGKMTQMRARINAHKPAFDQYTVTRGDYLWRISSKQDIYGDPYQWMRIYSFNRDMIKNPDLIYPDWTLKIHRETGEGEYLVQKGDFLAKIAGNTMGGPTNWMKIYEANKDIIGDNRDRIYPYTVLRLPQ